MESIFQANRTALLTGHRRKLLKAAGELGLLIGIGVPVIGIAAEVGLTLFFVGAITTHLRARDYSLGNGMPVMFLAIVLGALLLGAFGRRPMI